MRVVIQRVTEASIEVEGVVVSSIGQGTLVLAAFRGGDSEEELEWMARKCLELRIFEDENAKMNRSVLDMEGEVLVVSQFTLYGNCRKGRRPAYTASAPAAEARELYRSFLDKMSRHYPKVAEGVFGAKMKVHLLNDGPVTLIIDRGAEGL
ncbi:MAG: D-tyrosyl-tRNA(Tyr) deacylase [Candidatus Krumholzibacteria bacterium]|nr:D-tyrosyl-tRNA(Tyr) deacylase [Candidatus Krumholzibacteria bacterium]